MLLNGFKSNMRYLRLTFIIKFWFSGLGINCRIKSCTCIQNQYGTVLLLFTQIFKRVGTQMVVGSFNNVVLRPISETYVYVELGTLDSNFYCFLSI